MSVEVWTPVRGDGGKWETLYEVSSLGRIRSCIRASKCRGDGVRTLKPKLLTPCEHKSGYLVVGLTKDGKTSQRLLHCLVALSFHGDRPGEEYQAAHDDGDRKNCAADNITWKTRLENADDKRRHGTNNEGEKNARARLSNADALEVVQEVRSGIQQTEVAKARGVRPSLINHIMTGRAWSTVTGISTTEGVLDHV